MQFEYGVDVRDSIDWHRMRPLEEHWSSYLLEGKFDKTFAEEIFNDFLTNKDLDAIIANPKFKAVDTSEIVSIIEKVIADNPKEVEKAQKDPKMINWLVGQAMKHLKNKAYGPILNEKFTKRIS